VCLNGGLQYNSTTDAINGFVDSGDCKSQLLADHALVFRIVELKRNLSSQYLIHFAKELPNNMNLCGN